MRSISVSKIAICCVAALALTLGFNNCGGFSNGILKGSISSSSIVNRAAAFNFSASARKVWIHPNLGSGVGPTDWDSMFSRFGDWSGLLSQTNVFQFFEWAVPQYSQAEINKMVAKFREKSVGIGLESPGLLPWCGDTPLGVVSAQAALKNMKPIYQAGGFVNFIALDSSGINLPIIGSGRIDNTCNFTVQQAIDQLVVYMKYIHKVHPEIVFGIIPNFPNYNYNGTSCYFASCNSFQGMDYKDVFQAIVQQARDSGEDFGFVHVDNPYEYMTNHRGVSNVMAQRIIPMKQQAEGFGLRFGVIMNSDLGGGADNQVNIDSKSVTYYDNSKATLALYADGGGLDSMDFIVESWYNFPHWVMNETSAYSFTNLADQMIADYQNRLWGKGLSQPTANPAIISNPNGTTGTLASSDTGSAAASPSSAAANAAAASAVATAQQGSSAADAAAAAQASAAAQAASAAAAAQSAAAQQAANQAAASEQASAQAAAQTAAQQAAAQAAAASQAATAQAAAQAAAAQQANVAAAAAASQAAAAAAAQAANDQAAAAAAAQAAADLQAAQAAAFNARSKVAVNRYVGPNGNHLFARADAGGVPAGWSLEGPVFSLYTAHYASTTQLYKCNTGGHQFLSTDAGCEGQTVIGQMGWISTAAVQGSSPLYRMHTSGGDYIESLDQSVLSQGYILDGSLGYAP